jgi:hypothetical protein
LDLRRTKKVVTMKPVETTPVVDADAIAYANLVRMLTGHWAVQALFVASKLGVPDHLHPAPQPATELAARVGADAVALERILRGLAAVGVVRELEPGWFELTAMGQLLRSDVPGSVRDLVLMSGEEQYTAWGHLLPAVRAGTTAFVQAFGTELFSYLGSHPEAARTFDGAMVGLSRSLGDSVARQVDLAEHRIVVDLGGGRGVFLWRVLERHPHLRGVVFDLPHVAAAATHAIAGYGLAGRCEAIGGDFFEDLPEGGDLYVFCQTLFNWNDERVETLLSRVRSVLPPHGAVLVVEQIRGPEASPFAAMMDLQMMAMPGGRVRTQAEYARLAQAAGLTVASAFDLAPLATRALVLRPA